MEVANFLRGAPSLRFLRGMSMVSTLAFMISPAEASEQVVPEDFKAVVSISSDGANYDPVSSARVANVLVSRGLAADIAVAGISSMVRTGVRAQQLPDAVSAAAVLSAAGHMSFRVVSERVGKAFTGSLDDVRRLDKEFNFLTFNELSEARRLENAGQFSQARTVALAALMKQVERASE